MRTLIAFLAFFLALGGAVAYAKPHLSDVQYFQAARCAGLMEGSGASSAAIDAILDQQGRARQQFIFDRAKTLRKDAARAIRKADGDKLQQLTAERDGPCAVLVDTASAGSQPVS